MVFTVEHKTFLLAKLCKIVDIEEFQAEFPNFSVDYIQFKKTLDRAVNLLSQSGSVLRKPGSGAVRKCC
jgi:hypothetical protein